ncbi:hypothetical protein WJ63_27545 [Burkholderia pyrrocinia]|nr:hypothetical protein WJ63_27545 [Burkholderia pyrrocinia]
MRITFVRAFGGHRGAMRHLVYHGVLVQTPMAFKVRHADRPFVHDLQQVVHYRADLPLSCSSDFAIQRIERGH